MQCLGGSTGQEIIINILSINWYKKKLCFTVPLIFGLALWASILPTSHDNTLLTGSNAYFPWLTVRVQFKTDLGMGISTLTDSNYKKTLLKNVTFSGISP